MEGGLKIPRYPNTFSNFCGGVYYGLPRSASWPNGILFVGFKRKKKSIFTPQTAAGVGAAGAAAGGGGVLGICLTHYPLL